MPCRHNIAAAAATGIAALGATALLAELGRWLAHAAAIGTSPAAAIVGYLRFFTILTNWGVAVLMGVHARALWRGTAPPPASLFRAAAVYMLVTGVTYELLLRQSWSADGLSFWLDLVFHDLQPALTLLFWLAAAPKRDLRWGDLPWIAAYPAAYFTATLVAGALGAGYPYDFLDAGKLGTGAVLGIGAAFLAAILALGGAATAAAPLLTGDRSAKA